jgi:ABC-type multidrug transport system ATPase subunit
METIQKVAASGRTVITTIHQPRSSVFATFHKLLLLHQGNQLFFGPTSRTPC